ncbi:MAG: S8 family serine peptidase [Faecousia sp.]
MRNMKRILALLLTLCMLATLVPASFAAPAEDTAITAETALSGPSYELNALLNEAETKQEGTVTVNKIENPGLSLKAEAEQAETVEELGYAATDIVTVIVVMEESSLLDSGFTKKQIAGNDASMQQINARINAKQDAMVKEISEITGEETTIGYRYSVTISGFSVDVPYGKLDEIAAMDGVAAAFVAPVYELPENTSSGAETSMFSTKEAVGAVQTWQNAGYTGAGMRIAVVDTGLDLDHPSFVDAPAAADTCLTKEEVAEVLPSLNATARYSAVNAMTLTADNLYRSEKVPFGFNYADNSLEITHDKDTQGDHGTHVAGIAAANAMEGTEVVGVAPDAQIIVMKVFGRDGGGANFDDILAAVEDCFRLDVDAVNLSLGSPAGFTSAGLAYSDAIYAKVAQSDMIAAIAAGNSTSAAYMNGYGTNANLTCDPDNGIVSSPATHYGATAVASLENDKLMSNYLVVDGVQVAFNDVGLYPLTDLAGAELTYVMVPGKGSEEDFAQVDVSGKIAVVERGDLAFTDKQTNAEAAGAIACIVYDNVDGDRINMQDAGLLPNAFISKADGAVLAEKATDGIGTLEIMPVSTLMVIDSTTAGQMSDFSSWGVTPDLQLVPDVTAPGGNIYSTVDNGKYATYGGTSMASPHIAGMSALVLQYLHEEYSELSESEMHTIAEALLMSTAEPVMEYEGVEYSPRKQGAGAANVYDAVTSDAYLTVDGGKPKVSLGDDDERTGAYSFSFEINNFSDETLTYALDASVLTDQVNLDYAAYGYYFMGETSRKLDADVSFLVAKGTLADQYDANTDGIADFADVIYLLDGINGVETLPETVEKDFDLNGDGILDTADAQLLYEVIDAGMAQGVTLELAAGESASVTVTVTLSEEDRAYIEAYYPNGIYIDGFVRCYALDEGNADLSLPFMGFYGDWSAARVFDGGWYYQDEQEMEFNRYVNVLFTEYGDDWYYLGVNPYLYEDYDPAHNVLSPNGDGYWESVAEIYLSMMRGAREIRFTYTDAATQEVLFESQADYVRKSYYISAYDICYPFIYSDYFVDGYDFTDADGNYLPDGSEVVLTIEAWLDDGDDIVDDTIEIPLHIDTEAPVLYEDEIAYLYNEYADSRRLEFYVSDNYDIAAVVPITAAGDAFEYIAVEDQPGEKTLISLDVSDYDSDFILAVCDYGGNESYYQVSFEGVKNYDKNAFYGYRRVAVIPSGNYLYATDGLNGWYSFETPDDMLQHTSLYGNGETNVNAAEYVDGYVIGIDTTGEIFAMRAGTYDRMPFGTMELDGVAYSALDMALDITDMTLYILTDELEAGAGGHLATLDLKDGTVTDLGVITGIDSESAQGVTLACDNEGILYTIDYGTGALYTIDPATCAASLVGQTGYQPQYMQSMTVDHATDKLYWAAYQGYTGESFFFEVDKTTGAATKVSDVSYNSEITALYKPYEADFYPDDAALEDLRLSDEKVYTTVGSTVTLKCAPVPYYARPEELVWTSSDPEIVTVKNGVLTAVAEGEAVVTVSCGEISASAAVVVNAYAGDITYFDMGYNYAWFTSNVAQPGGAELLEDGAVTNYGFTTAAYADGWVYAADYDGILWKLDPQTLAGQQVGSTGSVFLAMSFNYADGYLYAIEQAGSFWEVSYNLVRVNTATGETAFVMTFDEELIGSPIGGMAIDYDGVFHVVCMQVDYDTYETMAVMQRFTVADGEEGCEVAYDDGIILPLSFYNYCSLVYSEENGGFFWADDTGALYHLDISDPAEPIVVFLGYIGEDIGGVWALGMFMIPENEPEPNYAEPTDVSLTESFMVLEGGSVSASLNVSPWNAKVSAAYTTKDPEVATVSADGVLTGVSEGTTKLAAYIPSMDLTLEADVKVVKSAGLLYGYLLTELGGYASDLYLSFPDTDPNSVNVIAYNEYADAYADYSAEETMSVFAGAYYDGALYVFTQVFDNTTYTAGYAMGVINLTDFSFTKLAVCDYNIRDMEFDYTTGAMYAVLDGGMYAGALAQVDLETGEVFVIGNSGIRMAAMTVDAEGTVYAISETGNLYRMDKSNGEAIYVGSTGVKGDVFQSMHYDLNSGNTYWAQANSDYSGALYLIDLQTGGATNLGTVGGGSEVVALYTVPAELPEIPATVAPTAVALDERNTTYVGGTVTLNAKVLPASVSSVDQTLTWTSSDETIATVDNGVVTGVKAGTVTITATAVNGVKAECTLTVTEEARMFYVYDETNTAWIRFSAENPAEVEVVRDDAEDEAPIAAAIDTGDAIYAYDAEGLFYLIDGETFERTLVGKGISETVIEALYFSYGTWGYETAELPIDAVDLSYDAKAGKLYLAAMASDYDLWVFESVIGEVDLTTGEVTTVMQTSEAQPANLLVSNGKAFFVDVYYSGMLTTVELYSEEQTLVQQSLIPGYWGDYANGRSLIVDELTGTVYTIRDLTGGNSVLYTLTLGSGAINGLGTIGDGIVANSLIIK